MTTAIAELDERESTDLDFGAGQDLEVQLTTARRFPRSIKTFLTHAMEMATLDEDTAKACFYVLPRDGKRIQGPSARLAEIVASAWGHLRIGAKVTREDDRFVYAQGAAWDVQANVAITFEVRRRITDSKGKRYNDDMVSTTGNAASSIALRNAVFKTVPSAYWRPIFEACRKVAVGDAKTLAARRSAMLEHFKGTMAVEPARVFAALGVKGAEDITLDHLETMIGIATAIKEGDTSVEEAFPAVTMPQRISDSSGGGAPATVSPAAPSPSSEGTTGAGNGGSAAPRADVAPPQTPIGGAGSTVVDVVTTARKSASTSPKATSGSWWGAATKSGINIHTYDPTLGAQLEEAQQAGTPITLTLAAAAHGLREVLAIGR